MVIYGPIMKQMKQRSFFFPKMNKCREKDCLFVACKAEKKRLVERGEE